MGSLGLLLPLGVFVAVAVVSWLYVSVRYRTVVSTNTVHIVQSHKKTTSYGTSLQAGNVYYRWPRYLPRIGVTVIQLPVSNFDLSLKDYEAYDKDRVPFMVDVVAFFRIFDTATAAQRVASIDALNEQLKQIVQGAVRKVLASSNIDTIMIERAQFGQQFTAEVATQLKEGWGVEPVKAMELMDIRDTDKHPSKAVSNIMAKKTSHIEMESRVAVANNKQAAETAEIAAKQTVDIRSQEAQETVGKRTADKDKNVGIAQQMSRQEVLVQEKETATKHMLVLEVEQVRQAEITKRQQVVAAEQAKEVAIETAEGHLQAEQKRATAITAVGIAEGEAEKARLLAPVKAQIELAEKIATLPEYQQYLQAIRAIDAYLAVGSKQAEALQHADIKVIANTGKPTEGVSSVMDLFTSKGGTELGAMLEGVAQSPVGKAFLDKIGINASKKPNGSGNAPADHSA